MKLTELIVGVAATKRLVHLVVDDEITRPVREKVAQRFPDSKLQYLVDCPFCVGVWAGFAVMSPWTPQYVRDALAMAGLSDAVRWAQNHIDRKVG